GVLRFYAWAVRTGWLRSSPLSARAADFPSARRVFRGHRRNWRAPERSVFVLRQFESLPRPLASDQMRELLAELSPPYDLMARWQLYTGLRVGELLQLTLKGVSEPAARKATTTELAYRQIDIVRKGRKPGYIIASQSLLEETAGYVAQYRAGWMNRAARKRGRPLRAALFLNLRGAPVKKNTYQQAIQRTSRSCGFRATPHVLRSTFGCWMLARLERLAKEGVAINPLLIVKILMGHALCLFRGVTNRVMSPQWVPGFQQNLALRSMCSAVGLEEMTRAEADGCFRRTVTLRRIKISARSASI
ncbi:MAG: tyrosine-type recombinase/integrase, partial [Steroidobacteraceae bacterium]